MKKLLICSTFILMSFMAQQASAANQCVEKKPGDMDAQSTCSHAPCDGYTNVGKPGELTNCGPDKVSCVCGEGAGPAGSY